MLKNLCKYIIFLIFIITITPAGFCIKEKFKFEKSIALTSDKSVILYSYKGPFEPLNAYIDIEMIDIDLNNNKLIIKPVMPDTLTTVKKTAEENDAIAAINGGFFDYTNGLSVSYVLIDNKQVASPQDNLNLTSNQNIQPFLKDIYNRSELKVYNCKGKTEYEINFHNKTKKNCTLTDSLQGGPMLLPEMNLEKESFLVIKDGKKIREAANVGHPDARIAVGLTKDNHMIWLLVRAGYKDSKYYGLTIDQLAKLLKILKVKSALAYDGGTSTTLFTRLPDGKSQVIIGDITPQGKRIQAKVKSVLILKRKEHD